VASQSSGVRVHIEQRCFLWGRRLWIHGDGLAGVALSIAVAVCLVGVLHGGAVVARVPDGVPIAIFLVGIVCGRAVIADIADSVVILIRLIGIRVRRAIVLAVGDAVVVDVEEGETCVAAWAWE
jgi:hypothetical protein